MTTETTARDRRGFLAAVALADLPMPLSVEFFTEDSYRVDPDVLARLTFDTVAACTVWADALHVEVTDCHGGGKRIAAALGVFAGRRVRLLGSEPAPVVEPPVTGATRTRLAELAREVA